MGNVACYSDNNKKSAQGKSAEGGLSPTTNYAGYSSRSPRVSHRQNIRTPWQQRQEPTEVHLARYRKNKTLERTHYGEVWQGYDQRTGNYVAVKQSKRIHVDERTNCRTKNNVPEDVRFESEVHSEISRSRPEGIVNVVEAAETENYLYLVMDYADAGSLFDHLQTQKFNSGNPREIKKWKATVRHWFRILCKAVKFLHSKNICHKDLSLQNILLRREGSSRMVPLIADFGLCERFKTTDCMSRKKVGKANFASRECFNPRSNQFDAKANDVWCLGIILFMCLTQSNAYNSPMERPCDKLLEGRKGILDLLRMYRKDHLVDDIEVDLLSMIFREEKSRATIDQVLESEYCRMSPKGSSRREHREHRYQGTQL